MASDVVGMTSVRSGDVAAATRVSSLGIMATEYSPRPSAPVTA
jgi:hypothetical protein